MKHAGDDALDTVEDLLAEVRRRTGLREVARGRFYRGRDAFLHFHEDPAGVFADVKVAGAWKRRAVGSKAGRAAVLRDVDAALAAR